MKVILTGATGMLGQGVLNECIKDDDIEEIMVVTRRSIRNQSKKIKEIIISDFFDLSAIEGQLSGYDACFFCLGTTSVSKSETAYRRITINLTLAFAKAVLHKNPNITFNYISGSGTDSNSKTMWARVKGEAENALLNLGFKKVYIFRPAFTYPEEGIVIDSTLNRWILRFVKPFYPLIKRILPKHTSTTAILGKAMIRVVKKGYPHTFLECSDTNDVGS